VYPLCFIYTLAPFVIIVLLLLLASLSLTSLARLIVVSLNSFTALSKINLYVAPMSIRLITLSLFS
jgi:hypothetical protein